MRSSCDEFVFLPARRFGSEPRRPLAGEGIGQVVVGARTRHAGERVGVDGAADHGEGVAAEHVEQQRRREEPAIVLAELDGATTAEELVHLGLVLRPALGPRDALVDPCRAARHPEIRVAVPLGGVDELLPERDYGVGVEVPVPEISGFRGSEAQRPAPQGGVHVDSCGAQRDLQLCGVLLGRDVHARLAPHEPLAEIGNGGAQPLRVGVVHRAHVVAGAQVCLERQRRHRAPTR